MTFNITGRFIYYGYSTDNFQFVDSTSDSVSIHGLEFIKMLLLSVIYLLIILIN